MTSKRTKFPTSLPLALIAFGTLLFACGGGATPVKIGIVNNLRSLDPVVEAFQAEVLRSLDADVEFVSVTGNTGNLDAAVDELIAGDPDLVVSLTTPTSLMVGDKLEGTSIPQIFGMVTDPLGSHLVESIAIPGHNRTGVGLFHIQHALELTVKATGAQRIGVVSQPSDAASVSGLALAERAAASLGVELVVIPVEDDFDLDRALARVPSLDLDLFFLIGSPFEVRNLGGISLVARTWSIPTASALTVDKLPVGFMIGVAPESLDVGNEMAQRAVAILRAQAPAGAIPVGTANNISLLDLGLARSYGISVPDDALVAFRSVVGGS
jgi:putative ABC transport system substrate-binding protein